MANHLISSSYLHDVEVIHSDIKSLNFLVNGNKGVKLCDFGMSVRFHDVEIIGGSPSYMSPEHCEFPGLNSTCFAFENNS